MTNDSMKRKMNTPKSKLNKIVRGTKVEEPEVAYITKQIRLTKQFTFSEFIKIAENINLTQKEWSDILHISERTLQRYAKDNSVFNFSVIDRILLIDRVIKKGVDVFGTPNDFIIWLKQEPSSIEGKLDFGSLASFDGTAKILNQLGRIEHGILA
ncbi:MAG: antitoxin Xre-like helix-turn-helix domain-containing protein [Ginsengibacter sp.]